MTDFDLQQQLINQRRQQYAGQRDFRAPQGQMVGGHFVAPNVLQYLAEGLRSIGGMRGQELAEQELKDLTTKRQTAVTEALRNFGTMAQGTPENAPGDGMGPTMPAQAPDMRGAYAALMDAPDAGLRQAGMQGMAQIPQMEARAAERAADLDFRRQEAEAGRTARTQQLEMAHQQRMEALAAQNASREQMAEEQREFQREMAKMRQSMGSAASQPYFQPVQTAQGVMAFNARTGRVEPVMGPNGTPIVGAASDPVLQGQLAGAKTGATVTAKSEAERRAEAPQVVQQGEESIRLVDDLLKSPGFGQAVGASRMLGVQNIPGTAAKDFDIRLDQLKGQQFLQAFESLKGGGQITEVEGKKATDAISRMNATASEAEFKKAAKEFQDVIRTGVQRAKSRIPSGNTPTPAGASGSWGGGATPSSAPTRLRFDAQGNVIQ